jgi:hypothetical protein
LRAAGPGSNPDSSMASMAAIMVRASFWAWAARMM